MLFLNMACLTVALTVSLFLSSDSFPTPLALRLSSLTARRLHMGEADLDRLLAACINLESLSLPELRLFNPRHMNPFQSLSTCLRDVRISFPRDDDFIPVELETHLLAALSERGCINSIELSNFSSNFDLMLRHVRLHSKMRIITFRCEPKENFMTLVHVIDKLNHLENLHLAFPKSVNEPMAIINEPDSLFHCNGHFSLPLKVLRITGEASPRALKFLMQSSVSLLTLDVGLNTLGAAILSWPSLLMVNSRDGRIIYGTV
jgi:hypothetical protein